MKRRPPRPSTPLLLALTAIAAIAAPREIPPAFGRHVNLGPAEFGGRPARAAKSAPGKGRYVYFVVDDSFKAGDANAFKLEVEYFDAAPGRLSAEFDGSDERAPFSGAYTRAPESVNLAGTKSWRKATFTLKDTKFTNAQNRGADFRLVVEAPDLGVGAVVLRR